MTNRSGQKRALTLTGYAEFTNNGNYEQDQVNLQYSQFVTRTLFDAGRIRQQIHGNLDAQDGKVDAKSVIERFLPWRENRFPPTAGTGRSSSADTGDTAALSA